MILTKKTLFPLWKVLIRNWKAQGKWGSIFHICDEPTLTVQWERYLSCIACPPPWTLSSSLDWKHCVLRGSLTRVMYIISPSQMSTVNTATATETLHNQGPMYTLWLTNDKADRLNCTKEICFSLKHRHPKARARQCAARLLGATCKAQNLHRHLWPWGILPPNYHKILLPGFQMDSVLIPWITQSFKHMTGALHCEHIMKEDWRQTPRYTALYKSWCREVLFHRAKIWDIEPYHILLSHPHTPRKHQLHRFIKQSGCMVRGIEVYGRIAFFTLTFLSLSSKCSYLWPLLHC